MYTKRQLEIVKYVVDQRHTMGVRPHADDASTPRSVTRDANADGGGCGDSDPGVTGFGPL